MKFSTLEKVLAVFIVAMIATSIVVALVPNMFLHII